MSKKSLFKSLIPSLVAVSFAGWGSVALAKDPIQSGDIIGDPCGGGEGALIAAFNLPDLTGNGIVQLPDGSMPGAIEMSGDEPPFKWINTMPPGGINHDTVIIDSIEIFGVVGDGAADTVVDQLEPGVEGILPETDGFTALYQVYFCGKALLVEMSDATVELASGKATFMVDPVSEIKGNAMEYQVVCTAESDVIRADGRTNYEVDLRYDEVKCSVQEKETNGKINSYEADVK